MAGRRIQGITIEIGGDTTKLQSALKDVDKRLSTTQAALKDVNKLLKLNPGNTELLVQKQKNLTAAIDGTKERLRMLRDVSTESLSPEQYDALQREIIETENNLKSLEKEYREFGSVGAQKMKAFGSAIQDAGDKIAKVGTGLSTYVTAPIVALGTAAYAAFTDVDKGMDTIVKKTGATGEALDEMGEIMKNIATTIPTDFETAGEAVGEVNTRFGLTGDALEKLSTQYIKFAEINGTDVTGAIDSTQKAMAAFGLDVKQADEYLDHLTVVSQKTGVSVDTLASGTVKNATAFKEMGLNIYGAAEFMGMLEVSGADSSAVMSGLSKALKNATDKGIPLDKALSDLQETILNGKDGTDGLTEAYDLFGKSGAQVYEAVKNGTLDFKDLTNAADGLSDAVNKTFEGTLDPADRFKTVVNELKVLGNNIATVTFPLIESAIEKAKTVVQRLSDAWNSLSEEQKETIMTVLGVAAAVGPVLLVIGKLATGIGGLITLLSGPAGIVVAIGAVIAIGYELITHWDEVKEKAQEIWEKIKGFFKDGYEKIKNIDWAGLGRWMWEKVKSAFASVGDWLKGRFDEAVTAIKGIDWSAVGSTVWGLIKDGLNGVGNAAGAVGRWFVDIFSDAWQQIKDIDWSDVGTTLWDAIKAALSGIGEWFVGVFKTPINAVIDMLNGLITKVETGINRVIRGINGALSINIPSFSRTIRNPFTGTTYEIGFSGYSWKPGLSGVTFGRIKELANGGVVSEGQRAIVGEYAPEYLRVLNGRAVVTPLDNTNAESRYGGTTNNVINVYAQPGQSATQIAEEVQRIMVQQQRQREAAYA